MACATATFPDVSPFDGRVFAFGDCRRFFGRVVVGLGTVAAAGVVAGGVTLGAMWMVCVALSTNPHNDARAPIGPATIALANHLPTRGGAADFTGSAWIWSNGTYAPTRVAALAPAAVPAPSPTSGAPHPRARSPERMVSVPLPRPQPAKHEIAHVTVEKSAPRVAAAAPPLSSAEQRSIPPQAPHKSISLPALADRTAVYDIAAHVVYLPNGDRLEAHSGLGKRLDNPRYVNEKDRGPTPPNVYSLVLRKQLFHGVQAIRLNPVGDGNMFGRDGMLAHSYMLGPTGQSFGCVSFKDYPEFLHAFLKGEVDRLVVVPHLGTTVARAAPPRRRHAERYAFNNR
jgi:hypothetical protein